MYRLGHMQVQIHLGPLSEHFAGKVGSRLDRFGSYRTVIFVGQGVAPEMARLLQRRISSSCRENCAETPVALPDPAPAAKSRRDRLVGSQPDLLAAREVAVQPE